MCHFLASLSDGELEEEAISTAAQLKRARGRLARWEAMEEDNAAWSAIQEVHELDIWMEEIDIEREKRIISKRLRDAGEAVSSRKKRNA